jgi:hypothetical protein
MARLSMALAVATLGSILGIGFAAAVPISKPVAITDESASHIELVRQGCGSDSIAGREAVAGETSRREGRGVRTGAGGGPVSESVADAAII